MDFFIALILAIESYACACDCSEAVAWESEQGAYSSDEECLVAELCKDDHNERRNKAVAEAQSFCVLCLGVTGRRILETSANILTRGPGGLPLARAGSNKEQRADAKRTWQSRPCYVKTSLGAREAGCGRMHALVSARAARK